jgi:ferric-dicitrate binding protein FerR (iron transport regulator)
MHAFLSYVKEDRSKVLKLAEALRSAGVKVWLDRKDLRVGQRWKWAIRSAIEGGHAFIACFSGNALARPQSYMYEELQIAIGYLDRLPFDRRWLLPVIFDDSELPPLPIGANEVLGDLHHVRLGANWDEGISRILETLGHKPRRAAIAADTKRFGGFLGRASAFSVTSVALALGFYHLGFLHWNPRADPSWISITNAVEAGSRHLPDGSVVTLARDTALKVHMTPFEREVILERGEALFTVSHHSNLPFYVVAAKGKISALGTAFDVRVDAARLSVSVFVTEGAVRVVRWSAKDNDVSSKSASTDGVSKWPAVQLVGGQAMTYSQEGAGTARAADVQAMTEWVRGGLVYEQRPLGEVVEDVTRYSGRKIVIDTKAAQLPYTGRIKLGMLEQWLQGLQNLYSVDVQEAKEFNEHGTRIVIRYRAGADEAHNVTPSSLSR